MTASTLHQPGVKPRQPPQRGPQLVPSSVVVVPTVQYGVRLAAGAGGRTAPEWVVRVYLIGGMGAGRGVGDATAPGGGGGGNGAVVEVSFKRRRPTPFGLHFERWEFTLPCRLWKGGILPARADSSVIPTCGRRR
jgi:hypothetical protein